MEFAEDGQSVFALQNGMYKQLTFDGKVLNDSVVSDTFPLYYSAYDPEVGETVSVRSDQFVKYQAGSRYGVFSLESGKVILPARYEEITLLSPHLIAASLQSRRQILWISEDE